ncbi:hypothetical protein Patl1_14737 [Pistacia atlantica]|uniref:Uncharacterized protein n=1 Tax=Pistacia atlantica TaxID=434234 RepID=A0ACC1AU57_9ROSI|nr:hypothetical protein Patl1_14737 [Pistacia atlantica]
MGVRKKWTPVHYFGFTNQKKNFGRPSFNCGRPSFNCGRASVSNGHPSIILVFNTKLYLNEDEDWVIVKKQKVTILVLILPTTNKSTMPTLGPSQRQALPRKAINKQSPYSTDACSKKPIVDEQDKSASLAPKRGIQIARKTPNLYVPAIAKRPLVDSRMELENPVHARGSVSRYTLRVMDISRTIRRSRTFHGISGSLDRSMLLNQRLRALNLPINRLCRRTS